MKNLTRCTWATNTSPLAQRYHDTEWGVPRYDDQQLFEFLCLEGAQAGLSWNTILKKRAHYRHVYDNFDPHKIARYGEKKQAALLIDPGIIRNRLKVAAFVKNAQAFLVVQKEYGSFSSYIWSFVGGQPIQHNLEAETDIPSSIDTADTMSKALKKRGFTFVGPTICYAFIQATGMVNDHTTTCFRHAEVQKL
jgi:DNA-3-methyladenine glycosylase I